jgi:hypothetical protein
MPGNEIPNEDGFVAADQDAVIPDVLAGERFAASPDFDGPEVCPGAVILDVVLLKRVVHGFCFFVFVVGLISFNTEIFAFFARSATTISQIVRFILLSAGACRVAKAGAETRAAPRSA